MSIFIIIVSVLLWIGSLAMLFRRELVSPAMSYVALLLLSFGRSGNVDGTSYPLLPINTTILTAWLCMTLVVMAATVLQSDGIKSQHRGMGYMLGGALAGLAVGLLGFTFTVSVPLLYGCMVIGVAAGVFFGFLLFASTPSGAAVSFSSGNFFRYLLAKGFPTAITVMMPGVVLVMLLAIYNNLVAY